MTIIVLLLIVMVVILKNEVKFTEAKTDRDLEVCKHMFRDIVNTMLIYVNPQWQNYDTNNKINTICDLCKHSDLDIELVKKDSNIFMKIL